MGDVVTIPEADENRVLTPIPDTVATSTVSETLWTDDTGVYFVRVNRDGVISWAAMDGTAAEAPGIGARPSNVPAATPQ